MSGPVLRLADVALKSLVDLLSRYQLRLELVEGADIPGSFWGDEEAGLIADTLFARLDTPVHSILHEACHYICMDGDRRSKLDTNAEGDYDEENAVCYLQILLADCLPGVGSPRILADMDAWGYTFRLGAARLWFEQDAEDACRWLAAHNLIGGDRRPTWRLRS